MRPTLPAARVSSQLAAIAESLTGTKIKNIFVLVLIPKPFLKFPDKLIGKGCPTTGVLSMWNEKQRIASLHLAETFEADSAAPWQRAPPLDHVQVAAVRAAWHES